MATRKLTAGMFPSLLGPRIIRYSAFSKEDHTALFAHADNAKQDKKYLLDFVKRGEDMMKKYFEIDERGLTPFMKPTVRVVVTGAAGPLGTSLLFRIASGQMLGPDQPVILHCLETPDALGALQKTKAELEGMGFPLLKGLVLTDNMEVGFGDVKLGILAGAKPPATGRPREAHLKDNAAIFAAQGQVLNLVAHPYAKFLVVGHPANTNTLVLAANTSRSPYNFAASMQLPQNRTAELIASKAGAAVKDVDRVVAWGNGGGRVYADATHARVKGDWALAKGLDMAWVKSTLVPAVQGPSDQSPGHGAAAVVKQMREWEMGTGEWTSVGVVTDSRPYGIPNFLYMGMPCVSSEHQFMPVSGLPLDAFSAGQITAAVKELLWEREQVMPFLQHKYSAEVEQALRESQIRDLEVFAHGQPQGEAQKEIDQLRAGQELDSQTYLARLMNETVREQAESAVILPPTH